MALRAISIIPICVAMLALLLWVAHQQTPEQHEPITPDFRSITDVKLKKQTFFEYMLPLVQQSNEAILLERDQLLKIAKRVTASKQLSSKQSQKLESLAEKYRVAAKELLSAEAMAMLDRRVDIIPPALALAQAANESGWGTARFAVDGNNFFGLWCWSENCGLVPNARSEGQTHEVARFETPLGSVMNYMLTLNSHPAYKKLRDLRSEAKTWGRPPEGSVLAGGLLSYSERGEAYIEELRAMIRVNELDRFDDPELVPGR